MTPKPTHIQSSTNIDFRLGKLPPQAVDIEESLLGACLFMPHLMSQISYLKPEHFYKDAHGIIWGELTQMESPTIVTLTHQLRKTDQLEIIGGAYYLSMLQNRMGNLANIDYMARVIQQMFIKREIIRVSGKMIKEAYELSSDPIKLFDQFVTETQIVEDIFTHGQTSSKIISGYENEMIDLQIAREGQRFTGLSTGYVKFDDHFRFKPATFVILNGHDNVGKTFVMIHLAVCANVLHGWKWIFACMENSESRIRQDIIQAKTGKHISRLTQDEFMMWYDWSLDNFSILRIDQEMTAEKLLRSAKKVQQKEKSHGFFIDPYNALTLPKGKDKFFNSHEYHYEVTNSMRNWIKQTGCGIYLSTHAVTEALRNKHKDGDYQGYPMPPQKADVEGGGKFANRADDFLTIHRYTNHPTEANVTHIHVRKIKDNQTGGRPTIVDDPVKLKTVKGYFGLFDEQGKSPLINIHLSSQFPIRNDGADF